MSQETVFYKARKDFIVFIGIMPLNPEQQLAVNTRHGAYAVTAIPGSGKTTVFSARAKAILAEGCPPEKFLGLTFTKSAALEFEARSGYKPGPNKPKIFRTFHGYCLDFATQEHRSFPFNVQRFPLLLQQEQYGILGPIVRHASKRVKYRDVQSAISQFKRAGQSPQQALVVAEGDYGTVYAEAYSEYEAKCRQIGKMDFDSLMIETVALLESNSEVLSHWQPNFLQCDEAQDNDTIQWRLLQLLYGRSGNIFAVGDCNQAMYGFRAAEPDGLLPEKFNARFANARQLTLPENYRSTKTIVSFCESIAPVPTPMRTRNTQGEEIRFLRFQTDVEEAQAVLTRLTDANETAILARTNRQLAAFEKLCGERDIKYKLLGKSGFFHQPEVENVLALAQYYVNPTDYCVKQIIRSPYECSKFIRKSDAIDYLEDQQRCSVGRLGLHIILGRQQNDDFNLGKLHDHLRACRERLNGRTAQDALRNLITHFGILHHYEDDEDAIDNSPADNIRALLRMAESKASLLDFVHTCLKAKQASRATAKRLTLSTVHQSKGKEWENVFVVGVNEGTLPHKNGDIEEERRIFFVACSRAAKRLSISCSDAPSAFLKHRLTNSPASQVEVDLLETMYRLASTGAEK